MATSVKATLPKHQGSLEIVLDWLEADLERAKKYREMASSYEAAQQIIQDGISMPKYYFRAFWDDVAVALQIYRCPENAQMELERLKKLQIELHLQIHQLENYLKEQGHD